MATIATVTGTAIKPGVSRNNRKYTAEVIGRMVERAQVRIDDPDGMPITMLTHHAADDDSSHIVGQVLRIWQESDGAARFEAAIDDTPHGRTIATLADPKGRAKPTLKGVSIRGAWLGRVRRESDPEAGVVEAGDDLELDGLDYTRKPGVAGAVIDSIDHASAAPRESDGTSRVPITESAPEATVTITEADASDKSKAPYGDDANYADPGYQKDKKKRYPLNTKQRAKSAWSYINQADNARLYTSAQLKRIKQRIVKALKGYGVQVSTQERWLIEPAQQVTEALAECWGMDQAEGNLYLSLTNGPTTVTVSSRILDAHDLDLVGRAAMAGACDALMALDPDMDADIDVPGAEPEDTDMDDEPEGNEPGSACGCGCGCAVPHPMAVADGCPCGCGCDICKATDGETEESAPLTPYAVGGQPFLPSHFDVLKASGVLDRLKPGEPITAAMVNEAIDAQKAAESAPETPAPETAADNPTQETEPAMAESTTPAAETPGTTEDNGLDALSAKFDKLTDAITGLVTQLAPKPAAAESAPADPVAEAAPEPVQETQDQRIERLVAERVAAAKTEMVQETVERYGPPSRKGLVHQVAETSTGGAGANGLPEGWPDKPLHTYTREERAQYLEPLVVGAFLGDRANKA